MAGIRNFTDLLSWQKARDWQKVIWTKTQTEPFKFDHRLVVQINDSTDSVMANIAEGFGRGTQGEFVQFLGYSIASVNETQSHLVVAYDRQFGDGDMPVTPALHEAIAEAKEIGPTTADATAPSVKLPPGFLQPSEQTDSMGLSLEMSD